MAKPPHTKCSNESILPGFQMVGMSRRLEGPDLPPVRPIKCCRHHRLAASPSYAHQRCRLDNRPRANEAVTEGAYHGNREAVQHLSVP